MIKIVNSVRKRVARLRSFPQIRRIDDCVFILDPMNWIDNRLLGHVRYETSQLAYCKAKVLELNIRHVIDIGANFGLYTVTLGVLPMIDTVSAFEPVAQNFHQLCGNIFANRLDRKATAHRCALGAAPGIATIHIDPRSTGVSRFDLTASSQDPRRFAETEQVRISPGDDYLDLKDQRVFAKIDVEGHTLSVLSGLTRFLTNNSGFLQVELYQDGDAATKQLAQYGWLPSGRIGDDSYFERAST